MRSKGGAYRITLLDAQEIGTIKGVRFVGMARKPRSRPVAAAVPFPAPIRTAEPCRPSLAGRITCPTPFPPAIAPTCKDAP